MMKTHFLAAALVALLVACGSSSKSTSDSSTDTTADTAPADTAPDTPADAPTDTAADTHEDTAEDTATDVDPCDGCMEGLDCCAGRCVNLSYDPAHCGACDSPCAGDPPYCEGGACTTPPCATTCPEGQFCCGGSCCTPGQICCVVLGGPVGPPTCHDDVCPGGCPLCP
jgi:hypothetical protein